MYLQTAMGQCVKSLKLLYFFYEKNYISILVFDQSSLVHPVLNPGGYPERTEVQTEVLVSNKGHLAVFLTDPV